MPGFTDNPWEWFAGADAVLVPSRWEGMPNVALEALACGAPVIATPEAGGIAELADETGGSAVRVCPAGSEFIEAMNFMHHGVPEIRPSLLPPRYDHKVVNGAFAALLEGFL
jgi:glycosyltransferase involved in cell wall biosynthesis